LSEAKLMNPNQIQRIIRKLNKFREPPKKEKVGAENIGKFVEG